MEIELVINDCYGGFALSEAATKRLCELKGWSWKQDSTFKNIFHTFDSNGDSVYIRNDLSRDDKDLVAVVKELGKRASALNCSELVVAKVIININDLIEDNDGKEYIK